MNAANQNSLQEDVRFAPAKQADSDLSLRCNAELYRTFYKQFYAAIIVGALNAVLVAGVVWSSVPHVPLLAWSGFLVCFSILRLSLLALRPRKKI